MDTNTYIKHIFDNVSDAIFVKDTNGKYVYFNHAAELVVGKKAIDVIGRDDTTLFPPAVAASVIANDQLVLTSRVNQTFEESLPSASGDMLTFQSTKGPIVDAEGTIMGIFGITHNITEIKRLETVLERNEKRWHSLFELLPVGVSIINSDNVITDLNPALCEKLHISKEGLLKGLYTARKYFRSDGTPMLPEEFPSNRAVTEKNTIKHTQIGVEIESGELIWVDVSAAPLSEEGGSVTVTVDITDFKNLEIKLRDNIKELNKINTFMLDRELKMIQLKKEIEELKKRLADTQNNDVHS